MDSSFGCADASAGRDFIFAVQCRSLVVFEI